jgi:predicted DNA-binding transcriptional regulator AlpA
MSTHDPLLDVPKAAEYTGLPVRQIREHFDRRRFELVKIGTRVYVRRSVIDAYLDAQTIPARG